jgi:hypothetical protein
MPKPQRPSPVSLVRPAAGTSRPARAAPAVSGIAAEAAAAGQVRVRRAEELLASIADRKTRIGQEFYEMGRELAELCDGKYNVNLGYRTFAAMIEGRKVLSRAVAWNLLAIYRSLPRRTANQLGPQRSVEWLRLLRVEAGADATDEEVRTAARQPAVVQGRAGPLRAELSSAELRELRRRTQERQALARKDPGAAQAHKLARALAQQLRRRGAEDALVAARYARSWRLRIDLALPAALALSKALGG